MRTIQLFAVSLASVLCLTGVALGQDADDAADVDTPEERLLAGQVLSSFGSGINDAEITAHLKTDDARPIKPFVRTKSDSLGDFEIALPDAARGTLVVTVKKDGFAVLTREFDLAELSEDDFVEAVLQGAEKLLGQVVAAGTRQPIGQALLWASLGGRQVKAGSGPDGKFEVAGIPPEGGRLTIEAEGFGKVMRRIDPLTLDTPMIIELKPERVLQITVFDEKAKKPIAGVLVEVFVGRGGDQRAETTGPDGRVILKGLDQDAESLRVRLSHEDYIKSGHFNDEIIPDEGELAPKVVLPMAPGGKVVGRVVGPDGEPLFGARIVAGDGSGAFVPAQFSAFDGTFRVGGLTPGTAIVTIHHSFHAAQLFEVGVVPSKPATLDVKLEPGGRIGATIVDPDGKGVEDVRVISIGWKGHDTLRIGALSDADGRIEFDHVPAGDIRFRLYSQSAPTLKEVVMKAGRTDYRFVVDLAAAVPPPVGAPPGAAPGQRVVLGVGASAPDFSVTTLTGRKLSLKGLRGQYVFIDFWATWCPPCVAELPQLKRLAEATKDRTDFLMLGISLDQDRATLERFVKARGVSWPQVVGLAGGATQAATNYEVSGIPSTFLIDPDGNIAAVGLRGEGLVKAVGEYINPKTD